MFEWLDLNEDLNDDRQMSLLNTTTSTSRWLRRLPSICQSWDKEAQPSTVATSRFQLGSSAGCRFLTTASLQLVGSVTCTHGGGRGFES